VPAVESREGQAASPIRVFLLDDHEIVRRGVRQLLEAAGDFEVVGEARLGDDAVIGVAGSQPDVALLDMRLPDGSGVDVCRQIRASSPDVRCLMLTGFDDETDIIDALVAGASGVMLKESDGKALMAAIRAAATGRSVIDAPTAHRVLQHIADDGKPRVPKEFAALTATEREILLLIGEGLTNRQIGERVFLAEKTVKNHVTSILAKLGLSRRTQAAVMVSRLVPIR